MTGAVRPLVLLLDETGFSHRLSARFDPDKTALIRRETISRRHVLPLTPVHDTIIDEQARFTDQHLLAAIKVVARPLQPRWRLLGIPLAYREEVRIFRANHGTILRVAITHTFQNRLHTFFCRCYARMRDNA